MEYEHTLGRPVSPSDLKIGVQSMVIDTKSTFNAVLPSFRLMECLYLCAMPKICMNELV